MNRRNFFILSLAVTAASVAAAGSALAQDFPKYGDNLYTPQLGQSGKDVIWMPTPDSLVTRMLQAAKTTAKDLVYDLGAGDGKIPIAAAKQFGAKAVGIEYNPDMAALGKRSAEREGVADKVTIINGDIFKEDFSQATVVTMYLLPALNLQLRPQLLKMKPGTRLVSHAFTMGDWEADETFQVDNRDGYLWIVPADASGRWTLTGGNGMNNATLEINQKYQRIGGTLTVGGKPQQLVGAYVSGQYLGFTYLDAEGSARNVRATIDGNTLTGSARAGTGQTSTLTGRRNPAQARS